MLVLTWTVDMLRFGFFILFLMFLTGCQSIGPAEIKANRKVYNDVARESELEQLLQNIVRLRYSESSYFLKMTSLTASYSLSSSLSMSPSLSYNTNSPGSFSSVSRSLSLSPSISYSDSPTLSFVPIESAEFATQVQTPLTLAQLLLPYSSGNYSEIYDFVFMARLVFDSIGEFSNGASLTTVKLIELPRFKSYYKILHYIYNLRIRGAVDIREFTFNNVTTINIKFISKKDAESPDAMQLKKLLNLPLNSDGFYLSEAFATCIVNQTGDLFSENSKNHYLEDCPRSKAVHIETRSILGVARFLSYGIQVPESDLKKGYAHQLKNVDGTPYNIHPLFHNLFTIYSSDKEPVDVYVKTFYRGHWFYIKSTDVDSKVTFTFLQRLMTLIAGSQGAAPQAAPVLTIPVGR